MGIGVLIGSVSTAGLFAMWLWIIGKNKGDGMAKIHAAWDEANMLSGSKNEILSRIADELEKANNIAQHK